MKNQETLGETLTLISEEIEKAGIVLANGTQLWHDFCEGLKYNQVGTSNMEILTLKGKKTQKWCHVVIERLDSGRYEPIMYCL